MLVKCNIQCSDICSTYSENVWFQCFLKRLEFTWKKISRFTLQHYSSGTDLHISLIYFIQMCGGHGQSHDPQTYLL